VFHVKKLNPLGWVVVLILAAVPLAIVLPIFSFALIWIVISFTLAIIIAPLLWKFAGKSLLASIFVKNFEIWKESEQESSPLRTLFNAFIGVKISPAYFYFLEGRCEDLNLNSFKTILTQRILNVTSASIGIAYIVATILRFIIPKNADATMIMGISLVLTLLGPLFLFWLIPMLWSIQDANIKYQDAGKDLNDLSQKISKSFLRKLIGITGITFAFSFFLDSRLLAESAQNIIQRYAIAGLWVVFVVFLNIGVSLFAGIVYLNFYHQKVVNEFRAQLGQTLEIGVTSVRTLSEQEQSHFPK